MADRAGVSTPFPADKPGCRTVVVTGVTMTVLSVVLAWRIRMAGQDLAWAIGSDGPLLTRLGEPLMGIVVVLPLGLFGMGLIAGKRARAGLSASAWVWGLFVLSTLGIPGGASVWRSGTGLSHPRDGTV